MHTSEHQFDKLLWQYVCSIRSKTIRDRNDTAIGRQLVHFQHEKCKIIEPNITWLGNVFAASVCCFISKWLNNNRYHFTLAFNLTRQFQAFLRAIWVSNHDYNVYECRNWQRWARLRGESVCNIFTVHKSWHDSLENVIARLIKPQQ